MANAFTHLPHVDVLRRCELAHARLNGRFPAGIVIQGEDEVFGRKYAAASIAAK
jgi:hypothetical protein